MCKTDDMRDYPRIARELIRALRGRRSQAHLSRRLGYASNVVFDWEAGRRFPTAATALRVARRVGVDLRAAVSGFLPAARWPRTVDPASRQGVALLLRDLRGQVQIGELAAATGCSRFAVSRWLRGHTEPRLPDLLRLVDGSSLRLLDFLAAFVDVSQLPALQGEWQQLSLARQLAYDVPWSHAVLRVLELASYQKLPRHVPGLIAGKLGISLAEEQRCLELLARAGQIYRARGRYRVDQARTVDTRYDPARSRELRAFWSRVGVERMLAGADGDYAFNLFSVSSADLERLRGLQQAYFQELRSIVARSEPADQVVLANLQLLPLAQLEP